MRERRERRKGEKGEKERKERQEKCVVWPLLLLDPGWTPDDPG